MSNYEELKMSEWKKTACILCELNCGIEVLAEDGEIKKVRGDKQHPASKGYLCQKASRLNHYHTGRDRVTAPLRRMSDGQFEKISWDRAIAEIAAKLGAIKDQHGGDKIFYYGGGGQGNHLPGAYSRATLAAFGAKYKSTAIAQEKTGEIFVNSLMLGNGVRGDFEHSEVSIFIGKNPWQSHGIPRARVLLREINKDPNRKMIVIDPRVSETAELADYHLAVKPGADAWLIAAILGELVQQDGLDHEWIAKHTQNIEEVLPYLQSIPVAEFAEICRIERETISEVATLIAKAESVAIFEDLGVQMNRHSTLVSYLEKLIWVLTGNFGKQGTQYVPTQMGPIASFKVTPQLKSPVVGAPIISGLVPCNVISEEILTDHPDRYRAMIVESGNPVHSVADSKRMRQALRSLECVVVIDIAMTETAKEADYILPTANQYEKAEATFFNFEFPENYFHLRHPVFEPPANVLPEPEIHARLVEAAGVLPDGLIDKLRARLKLGRMAFAMAFQKAMRSAPGLMNLAPVILYRTIGENLSKELKSAAVLWGSASFALAKFSKGVKRAIKPGLSLAPNDVVFEKILNSPSGFVFSHDDYQTSFERIRTAHGKINLLIPDLLEQLQLLSDGFEPVTDAEFPYVLAAGERRSFTANTIYRDPSWRRKDLHGALRISEADAQSLGLASGEKARLTTRAGSAEVVIEVSERMPAGNMSLPNGQGIHYPNNDGQSMVTGTSTNELTSTSLRDFIAGTPWHKHVPAKLEAIA